MRLRRRGGIVLEHREGVLYLDPRRPVGEAFISHGHSDHHPRRLEGSRIHATSETVEILRAKGVGDPKPTVLGRELPAGHILGSSMLLVEVEGMRVLYTGDFRLEGGPLSPPPPRVRADILVMEATYGHPRHLFPPKEEEFDRLAEWVERHERVLLNCYSVGKAQEVIVELARRLGRSILEEIQVSRSVGRINEAVWDPVYRLTGIDLRELEVSDAPGGGRIFIAPAGSRLSKALWGRIPRSFLSGWSVGGFVISDHSDYPSLLRFVETVDPELVVVAYGYRDEFSRLLELELGVRALPLRGAIEI